MSGPDTGIDPPEDAEYSCRFQAAVLLYPHCDSTWEAGVGEKHVSYTRLGMFTKSSAEAPELWDSGSPANYSCALYNVVKVFEAAMKDDAWYTQEVVVQGKQVTVIVEGKVLFEYVEPERVTGRRTLSHGTFALQAHDPDSEVHFRNIRVKRLP